MKINRENIFFSTLLVLSSLFFALSYNFETRGLVEGTIQSGIINYPNEFNLFRDISINAWSLPIQIISILVKANISPVIISMIVIFISTLIFFAGVFIITRSLTHSSILAFLVSFLVVLLKKHFGHLDYPTMMFSEHTNGLMAQAISTLVFALLINNNLKLSFFLSGLLISVHFTVGLWLNFIILLTLILRFKRYKNIVFNKQIFIYFFLGLSVTLLSFYLSLAQKMPINFNFDIEAYKTYMRVWEDHRTAWGLYSNWINYDYIAKTLILILLISVYLKTRITQNNLDFGINILLISVILSLFVYIAYKYFYFLFPDIIVRVMPTRFFLLHSIIGWPVIFSILYVLLKSAIKKFYFKNNYIHFLFVLIIIINLVQHNYNFIERYNGIKSNFLINNKVDKEDEFWNLIKKTEIDGFYLTSTTDNICLKTVAIAKKPVFTCPETLNFIPYYPKTVGPAKKIVEEIFDMSFNNPKIKNMGGIHQKDLKVSYENKSYENWINLKNNYYIKGLIVPKKWNINLKVFFSNGDYSFYVIE